MDATAELSFALDTFYLLICGALVMWMAAGFAMLESGMIRAKNTAEILTKNLILYAVACVFYLLLGFGIMYPAGGNGFIPSVDWGVALGHWGSEGQAHADGGHARLADFFFRVVFVATAMSIVSGAVAERMKLWSFLLFAVVLTSVIYPVEGYWAWGGGWLHELGYVDFAGSGVVHICGAAAALAAVLVLGPRTGRFGKDGSIRAIQGANLPIATLGTFILWFGWFGFNGGSQLAISGIQNADAVAAIFVNTNLAAAGGTLLGLIISKVLFGKADLTMALNGALAGLVAITANPVSPPPLLAVGIGAIAGILVVFSIVTLDKLRLDDPVGAISVHGASGIWGLLAATFTGDSASLAGQLVGIGAILGWVFIASLATWLVIKALMGIRVTEEEEYGGLDIAECGIEAYPEFVGTRRVG